MINYQEVLKYFGGTSTTSSSYDNTTATYREAKLDWMREQLKELTKAYEERKKEEPKQEASIADDEWDDLMKNFRAT